MQGPSALLRWHFYGGSEPVRGSGPQEFPRQFPTAPPRGSWCPNHAAVRPIEPTQRQVLGGPTTHGGQGQHRQSHGRAAAPMRHPRRTQRTRPHPPAWSAPWPPSARTGPYPRPDVRPRPAAGKGCLCHSQDPPRRIPAKASAAAATLSTPAGRWGHNIDTACDPCHI